jgi:hypothetical protein
MASVSWPSSITAPDGTTIGFNSSGLLTVLQAPKLVLPSGISIQQDPSGYLGIFNSSGTEVETISGTGHHVFVNTSGNTSNYSLEIVTDGTFTTIESSTPNMITNADTYLNLYTPNQMYLYGTLVFDSGSITAGRQGITSAFSTSGSLGLGGFSNAGPYQIYNVGGFAGNSAFFAQNLSASYSTTSTTPVSTGLYAYIPVSDITVNSPIVVEFEGYGYNNTLGDGVTLSLYVSTAGVPAQGSAPPSTDTLLTSITVTQEGLVSNPNSMPITYVYTPTATGNYYFYIAVNAVTGGTATIATPSSIVARGW